MFDFFAYISAFVCDFFFFLVTNVCLLTLQLLIPFGEELRGVFVGPEEGGGEQLLMLGDMLCWGTVWKVSEKP